MNIEKYTDRARGFIQSAQSLALREGHQQFTPDHVLKVLLDDPEGLAAGLIDRSGGNSRQALQGVEEALGKIPKVSGSGSGQVYLAAATARLFDNAEKIAEKAGDSFVTVERLLLAVALEKDSDAGKILADRITWFMQRLDTPNGLRSIGYSASDIPALVEGTIPQHRVTKLSPRPAAPEDLARLFESAMQNW